MSKRGGRGRSANNPYKYGQLRPQGFNHWQSEELNNRTYEFYRNVIMQLAMSRFKWVGLPDSCDVRYLEFQLMCEGVATIAFPASIRGGFLTLKAALRGPVNMYGNPSAWLGIGDNGTRIACNVDNGVLVWDNKTRYPVMNGIELYANELTHIRIANRVNLQQMKMPFLLKGPQEKRQEMVNLFSKIDGGEPAIITTNSFSENIDIDAIQTGVEYHGEEFAQAEANVWNRIYTFLGSQNSTFKQERQTEDEIRAQTQPTGVIRLNSLDARREAARKLNERFGSLLPGEVQVVWNEDYESEIHNLMMNVKQQLDILEQ